MLGNIFGMENITDRVQFEKKVAGEKSRKRIDVYVPVPRVLVEQKSLFHDYMAQFDAKGARKGLRDLFRVQDKTPEDRDPYLADDNPLLASFPYVNGGLFSDEDIEIPPFTDEIMDLLLTRARDDFDWSGISPTIFGAEFESTLNPETRRSGGMHYTSIENIHKVIDPLFLDELKAELAAAKEIAVAKTRETALDRLQDKLASLTFLEIPLPKLIRNRAA